MRPRPWLALGLLVLLAAPGLAQAVLAPAVQVASYQLSPEVVRPGSTGSLTVTLYNGGNATAVMDQALLYAPGFEVLTPTYHNIGSLGPLQKANLTFVFRSPYTEGIYPTEVQVSLQTGTQTRYPVPIRVFTASSLYIKNTSFTTIAVGQTKTLTVTLASHGPLSLRGLEVELDPGDASPVDPLGPARQLVGDFIGVPEVQFSFPVAVKGNAVENVYSVPLVLKWTGPSSESTQEATLKVGMRVAGVSAPSLRVEKRVPESIPAGKVFPIDLNISNTGGDRATSITVNLNTSGPISVVGPNNIVIDRIESGESRQVSFSLLAARGTSTTSLYTVPLTLSYTASSVNRLQSEAITLRGVSELSVAAISTEPTRLTEGDFATLQVKVENIGNAEAKSVVARADLPFEGNREAALGKIEAGDDAPAVFIFRTNQAGAIPYRLTLEYQDDFGSHNLTQPAQLVVYSRGAPPILTVAAVVAIAAGGFLFLRRRRRRKDHGL
ncbi:MAG: hypothetical protein HY558_05985 [Euryarchaeota archaeon]|nr:hypothetical protein [Euryarchaeota archaeon]